MKVNQVMMTPGMAESLLSRNTKNRRISTRRVQELSNAILRGEWVEDANPIRISVIGDLMDGQHRVAAIAKSGLTVPVLLATDVEEAARLSIDSGLKRSFGHYLQIAGIPQQANVAAVTRTLWLYEQNALNGTGKSARVPTNTQLWDMFQKHEEIIREGIHWTGRVRKSGTKLAPSAGGASWVLFAVLDADDAEDFFSKLTLTREFDESSIRALIRALNSRPAMRGGSDQVIQLAYMIKAWNSYRDGREVSLIKWARGGRGRESFPSPR